METNTDINSTLYLIDTILNFTFLFACIVFVIYFRFDYKALWKTKKFSSNETLTSMSIAILISLICFFVFSYIISSIYSLEISPDSRACLKYTVQSFLLLAYVYMHVKAHYLMNINMHSLSKLCCLFANILICIQIIRFIDRLILETNVLSWAYRISVVGINTLIVITMIGSLIYLMIATQKLNRKEA